MKAFLNFLFLLLVTCKVYSQSTISLTGSSGINFSTETIPLIGTDIFIFNHSETVNPGEDISVQGYFSSNAILYLTIGEENIPIPLVTVSKSTNYIKATCPSTLPIGMYRIYIKDGSSRSDFKYINKAIGWGFNSSLIYSKATVAVNGKNLLLNKDATARFVSLSTGTSTSAIYSPEGSSVNKINLIAPSTLVTGQSYIVYITNGYGLGVESKVNDTLTAIAPIQDYFKLNLGWSAAFTFTSNIYNIKTDTRLTTKAVGNGSTNDAAAIQGAIDKANTDGGGIIYFPDGTYLYSGVGLTLKSNVVLMGSGKDKVKISYGTGGTNTYLFYSSASDTNIGINELSLECTNTSGTYGGALLQSRNTFLQNIKWSLDKGDWVALYNSKNIAIIDCEFDQKTNNAIHGPTFTQNNDHLVIKNSKFTFSMIGIDASFSRRVFIENNTLNRNILYPYTGIFHSSVFEFVKDVLISDNVFDVINGEVVRNPDRTPIANDGEALISEGGGPNPTDLFHGTVSSATINTLTDNTRSWSTTFEGKEPIVAIIAGRGAGQHRVITSRTANTLTLLTNWNIIPNSTSVYAMFNFGMQNTTIVNNKFKKNQRGITLYHCALKDVTIVNNSLLNSGSIDITPIQVIRDDGKHQFIPIYKVDITANKVDGNNNLYDGASIGVHFVQHITPQNWGIVCINLRINKNMLAGKQPSNIDMVQDEKFPTSIHAFTKFHINGTAYSDSGTPAFLGTIIDSNIIKDCTVGVTLSSATDHTTVTKNKQINVTQLIDNFTIAGSSGASTNLINSQN